MTSAPTATHTPVAASSLRWWTLATVALAQLMVVLDATVVNIALPAAQADLGFSDGDRQWVVTAYSLAFGSLLLLGGRLSDLWGRKRTFILGLIGFALASALAPARGGGAVRGRRVPVPGCPAPGRLIAGNSELRIQVRIQIANSPPPPLPSPLPWP